MFFLLSLADNDDTQNKLIEIYNLYRGTMIYTARKILDDFIADDAVSIAFLNIMKNIDKITDIDSHATRALVVIIVRNVARDILRKRKQLSEDSLDNTPEIDIPDIAFTTISAAEAVDYISLCIAELKTTYSDVLYLTASGLSNAEISRLLGITEDNVRQRLSRARKALQKKLSEKEERS